jgi:RNA polymerase sigma-32 factor
MVQQARPGSEDRKLISIAMSAPMLDAETETALARRWRDEDDTEALHQLTNAYMRLAISMASKYRRYGASMSDLIQEGAIGLMKAAERFDPDRGVRFSTYAVWWIKASIQDFVMRNWSLVRTGSTSSQKALFFNLRRLRAEKEREFDEQDRQFGLMSHDAREAVASALRVPLHDVEMMEARLGGSDYSLNTPQGDEEGREWLETIEDDGPVSSDAVAAEEDFSRTQMWIGEALEVLTDREKMIIKERKLSDEPSTLEALGGELGLSKERVRQLETQALKKMRGALEKRLGDNAGGVILSM